MLHRIREKLYQKKAQVTILFLTLLGVMMFYTIVLTDIGMISMNKTAMDVAVDTSALSLGSGLSSAAKNISDLHLNGKLERSMDMGFWSGWLGLAIGITVIVVIIVVSIITAVIAPGSGASGLGAALPILTLLIGASIAAGLAAGVTMGSYLIQKGVFNRELVEGWANSLAEVTDPVVNRRENTMLPMFLTVSGDAVEVRDDRDFDRDGSTTDIINRGYYYYSDRINRIMTDEFVLNLMAEDEFLQETFMQFFQRLVALRGLLFSDSLTQPYTEQSNSIRHLIRTDLWNLFSGIRTLAQSTRTDLGSRMADIFDWRLIMHFDGRSGSSSTTAGDFIDMSYGTSTRAYGSRRYVSVGVDEETGETLYETYLYLDPWFFVNDQRTYLENLIAFFHEHLGTASGGDPYDIFGGDMFPAFSMAIWGLRTFQYEDNRPTSDYYYPDGIEWSDEPDTEEMNPLPAFAPMGYSSDRVSPVWATTPPRVYLANKRELNGYSDGYSMYSPSSSTKLIAAPVFPVSIPDRLWVYPFSQYIPYGIYESPFLRYTPEEIWDSDDQHSGDMYNLPDMNKDGTDNPITFYAYMKKWYPLVEAVADLEPYIKNMDGTCYRFMTTSRTRDDRLQQELGFSGDDLYVYRDNDPYYSTDTDIISGYPGIHCNMDNCPGSCDVTDEDFDTCTGLAPWPPANTWGAAAADVNRNTMDYLTNAGHFCRYKFGTVDYHHNLNVDYPCTLTEWIYRIYNELSDGSSDPDSLVGRIDLLFQALFAPSSEMRSLSAQEILDFYQQARAQGTSSSGVNNFFRSFLPVVLERLGDRDQWMDRFFGDIYDPPDRTTWPLPNVGYYENAHDWQTQPFVKGPLTRYLRENIVDQVILLENWLGGPANIRQSEYNDPATSGNLYHLYDKPLVSWPRVLWDIYPTIVMLHDNIEAMQQGFAQQYISDMGGARGNIYTFVQEHIDQFSTAPSNFTGVVSYISNRLDSLGNTLNSLMQNIESLAGPFNIDLYVSSIGSGTEFYDPELWARDIGDYGILHQIANYGIGDSGPGNDLDGLREIRDSLIEDMYEDTENYTGNIDYSDIEFADKYDEYRDDYESTGRIGPAINIIMTMQRPEIPEAGECLYIWQDENEYNPTEGQWHIVYTSVQGDEAGAWKNDRYNLTGYSEGGGSTRVTKLMRRNSVNDPVLADADGNVFNRNVREDSAGDEDCVTGVGCDLDNSRIEYMRKIHMPMPYMRSAKQEIEFGGRDLTLWMEPYILYYRALDEAGSSSNVYRQGNNKGYWATNWLRIARFDEPKDILGWPSFSKLDSSELEDDWVPLREALEDFLLLRHNVDPVCPEEACARARMLFSSDRINDRVMFNRVYDFMKEYGIWSKSQMEMGYGGAEDDDRGHWAVNIAAAGSDWRMCPPGRNECGSSELQTLDKISGRK